MALAAPPARKLAKELGIDIDLVPVTAENGYVSIKDIEAFAGLPSDPEPVAVPAAPVAVDPVPEAPAPAPAPVANTRVREEESRGKLNHLQDDNEMSIAGMTFKRPGEGTLDHSTSKRLDIPKKYLNNELHYHWAIDDGGRVEQLRERLGYAAVPDFEAEGGDKITTRRRTGTNADGTPQYQQLMATPKIFREDRMKKKEEERAFKEEGFVTNPTDEQGVALSPEEYYMPEGSSIARK